MTHYPLHDVCCASLPHGVLATLAGVRTAPGVRVRRVGERTWVWWRPGDDDVLRLVLAASGVALYLRRDGLWYAFGHVLPAFDVPDDAGATPLAEALMPAPVQPLEGPAARQAPVALRLVRDGRRRAATAVLSDLPALARWATTATTAQLSALSAARCGGRVLVRGGGVPALSGGARFWGGRLLVPLGYGPSPALPERALREALGLGDHELGLFSAEGVEAIPGEAFEPLTRAGVRLAEQEAAP